MRKALGQLFRHTGVWLLSLGAAFGDWTVRESNMQVKIFELMPEGTCKVMLATNIAETLITLDGVDFVIDSGFIKQDSNSQGPGCLPW